MINISLRNVQIPVIKENEFSIIIDNEQNLINIFYGCLDIDKKEYCKKIMLEKLSEYDIEDYGFPYDFRVGCMIGTSKWYVEDNMNIYQSEFVTPATSLITYTDKNNLSFHNMTRDNLILWVIFKGTKKN